MTPRNSSPGSASWTFNTEVGIQLTYIVGTAFYYRPSLPDFLRDADSFYEQWSNCPTNELENANAKRSRAMSRLQQSLIGARELNDEKMQLAQALQVRFSEWPTKIQ